MKNKITDLRDHLFETIEALKDTDKPMDLERAKTIAGVAQVVINSAKIENDFMKITGEAVGSGFLPQTSIEGEAPSSLKYLGSGFKGPKGRKS